ncbi:MAG TPA: ABC transporter substrate-binding protein, partial [Steroidobacteraceae bacterium]
MAMTIRLSENFRALFYAPFYAAHAIGAYQDEGVDVVLQFSPDPARTAAALRAGDVDVMWGGPLRVLL